MSTGIDYVEAPPATAELVIVGGGIIGAATAFYAARAGLKPLLLERRPALCTLTTAASTGAFRLQFDNLEELKLVRESVELFESFSQVTDQTTYELGLRRQGYLWATTHEDRASAQRELVELQHSWGQTDVELLDGDEVRARWPYVSPEVLQARFRAGDGFLEPKALTMGLALAARATVVVDCGVTRIETAGERVTGVQTTRGVVSADRVVVAAGPFSGELTSNAGVSLPLAAVQRQKLVLPEVGEVPQSAPMTIDDDTGAHWRPALRGAYLLLTDPATPPSPPAEVLTPDESMVWKLLDPRSATSVARIAPFWARVWERGAAHWMLQVGQYDMTPDHRPLLGPTEVHGLFVNCGYSGHGIMAGPAGCRHLVDVMTGRIAPADNPFRLDRSFEPRALDIL